MFAAACGRNFTGDRQPSSPGKFIYGLLFAGIAFGRGDDRADGRRRGPRKPTYELVAGLPAANVWRTVSESRRPQHGHQALAGAMVGSDVGRVVPVHLDWQLHRRAYHAPVRGQ